MNWLSARRTKRRKTQTGAILFALGLIAGILGIAPAIADPSDGTSCWAQRNSDDTLDFWWSGVDVQNAPNVKVAWFNDATPGASAVATHDLATSEIYGHARLSPAESHPEYPIVGISVGEGANNKVCGQGQPPGDVQLPTFGQDCGDGALTMSVENQGSTVDLTIAMFQQDAQGEWAEWNDPATHSADGFGTSTFGVEASTTPFPFRMRVTGGDSVGGYALDESFEWTENPCVGTRSNPFDLDLVVTVDCASWTASIVITNNQLANSAVVTLDANLLLDPISDIALAANGGHYSTTLSLDLLPDGASSVTARVDPVGGAANDQVTAIDAVDCATPTPAIWANAAVVCPSATNPSDTVVNVTVGNTGDAPGSVTITAMVSNDPEQTLSLAAGEPGVVRSFTVDPNQPVTITITGDVQLELTPPVQCDSPAPRLTAQIACSATRVTGEWANTGNATGVVALTIDGSVVETWTMVPGTPSANQKYSADRLVDPFSGSHAIAVIAQPAGTVLASTTVSDEICGDRDNEGFVGSIVGVCEPAAGVTVTLTNNGAVADNAQLTINGSSQSLGPVDPGQTATFFVAVGGNATVSASLTHNGDALDSATWDNFCENPSANLTASVKVVCEHEEIAITIMNDGVLEGSAIVSIDGQDSDPIVVPAASMVPYNFGPITAGATYNVVITGLVAAFDEDVSTAICNNRTPDLAANTTVQCNSSQVEIMMSNKGGVAGTVTWSVNGAESSVLLQSGENRTEKVDIVLGGDVDIIVTSGAVILHKFQAGDLCTEEKPVLTATTDLACTASSIIVTVRNTGLIAGNAKITVGAVERTVTVASGGSAAETFKVDEDQVVTIAVVETAGATSLLSETRPVNCVGGSPAATVEFSCATDQVSYTLTNKTGGPVTFIVRIKGEPDSSVTLTNGETKTGAESVGEGESYDVAILVNDKVVASTAGVADCEGPIVPTVETKLARTGVNSGSLFLAAATLIVSGGFFVSAARTREQSAQPVITRTHRQRR